MSCSYWHQAAGGATGIEGLHNFYSMTPVWLWTTKTIHLASWLINSVVLPWIICPEVCRGFLPHCALILKMQTCKRERDRGQKWSMWFHSWLDVHRCGSRNAHDAKMQWVGGAWSRGWRGWGGWFLEFYLPANEWKLAQQVKTPKSVTDHAV